ncbi:hypothetical protein D3C71_1956170 [compost metagenome]
MAPMHRVPVKPMRIMLVEKMRASLETSKAIGVVHPAEGRSEMITSGKFGCSIIRFGVDHRNACFKNVGGGEPVND